MTWRQKGRVKEVKEKEGKWEALRALAWALMGSYTSMRYLTCFRLNDGYVRESAILIHVFVINKAHRRSVQDKRHRMTIYSIDTCPVIPFQKELTC